MHDSVEELRLRWTPELTAAALRRLRGDSDGIVVPTMEHAGKTCLDLRGIRIEETQLDGATIRDVNLRWATIRDVGFKDARLVGCDLSQTAWSACYFRRTVFSDCELVSAKFERCDFPDARVEDSRLDFASFKECEMTPRTLRFPTDADPRTMARLCRNLKLNAMSMGHFAAASELTYLEKTHERRVLHRLAFAERHAGVGARPGAVLAWANSVFLNGLWGYGEKPQRLTLAMIAIIVLFALLQYWLDGIPGAGLGAHLYFSGITFLTIGYGDLVPVAPLPRFLAVVEGAVGITVLGMLIAAWTKKIMYR